MQLVYLFHKRCAKFFVVFKYGILYRLDELCYIDAPVHVLWFCIQLQIWMVLNELALVGFMLDIFVDFTLVGLLSLLCHFFLDLFDAFILGIFSIIFISCQTLRVFEFLFEHLFFLCLIEDVIDILFWIFAHWTMAYQDAFVWLAKPFFTFLLSLNLCCIPIARFGLSYFEEFVLFGHSLFFLSISGELISFQSEANSLNWPIC